MRTALALTTALAWLMIQVPLVLCGCADGVPVTSALVAHDHPCHDAAARSHHASHCLGGATHHHGLPAHPAPEDCDCDHLVVLVQTSPQGGPVQLPAHLLTGSALAAPVMPCTPSASDLGLSGAWGELAPPEVADPVSNADRLQV